jgi:hypothetical protein
MIRLLYEFQLRGLTIGSQGCPEHEKIGSGHDTVWIFPHEFNLHLNAIRCHNIV